MRHICNIPGRHEDTISNIYFGYDIILDFYNCTLEDVLDHDLVDLTLGWRVMKYVLVDLILFHTDIIFHGDIKQRSIVQCGSS